MDLQEIKDAIAKNETVKWSNSGYEVIKDSLGEYLIKYLPNSDCIGLIHQDGVTMNANPEDFYIEEERRAAIQAAPVQNMEDIFEQDDPKNGGQGILDENFPGSPLAIEKEQKKRFDDLMKQSEALDKPGPLERNIAFEIEDLPKNLKVTENGNENVYFLFVDENGEIKPGFCKCL